MASLGTMLLKMPRSNGARASEVNVGYGVRQDARAFPMHSLALRFLQVEHSGVRLRVT